jgi:hypothetical protein
MFLSRAGSVTGAGSGVGGPGAGASGTTSSWQTLLASPTSAKTGVKGVSGALKHGTSLAGGGGRVMSQMPSAAAATNTAASVASSSKSSHHLLTGTLPVAPLHLLGHAHLRLGALKRARECFLACAGRLGFDPDWQMVVEVELDLGAQARQQAATQGQRGARAVATLHKHIEAHNRAQQAATTAAVAAAAFAAAGASADVGGARQQSKSMATSSAALEEADDTEFLASSALTSLDLQRRSASSLATTSSSQQLPSHERAHHHPQHAPHHPPRSQSLAATSSRFPALESGGVDMALFAELQHSRPPWQRNNEDDGGDSDGVQRTLLSRMSVEQGPGWGDTAQTAEFSWSA